MPRAQPANDTMEQLHLNEAMYMSSAPAQTSPAKTCLDNAVDHRLRELFRPVSKDTANTAMGSHLSRILEAGLSFERCDGPVPIHEIGVTQELAWSGSVVGILVMLLQPANTQLFDMGLDVAIQECGTFAALDKAFRAVSRGSLNIHDITIVDSLPFLRPKDEVFPQIRMDLRMQAFEIVEAKRPDVILCMWQDNIGVTGNMTFMRSIGIGRRFSNPNFQFESGSVANRVNAFHPSYAIHHNPNFSCFRQLLLLEIAQACHTYMGNWVEQEWMSKLREKCRLKASHLSCK